MLQLSPKRIGHVEKCDIDVDGSGAICSGPGNAARRP
jgi:hypothetical protein